MRTNGRSELIDLEVFIHHETEKAILVSTAGGDEEVWLPKSQVEINDRGRLTAEITLPESLPIEKGLV